MSVASTAVLIGAALAITVGETYAGAPHISKVDVRDEPIGLSAPTGWAVRIESVRDGEHTPTIASVDVPACQEGDTDLYIGIQLGDDGETIAQVFESFFPGKPVRTLGGVRCYADSEDVTCAVKPAGSARIVIVSFSGSADDVHYTRLAPSALVPLIAASITWHGEIAKLHNWERTDTTCKH